MISLLLDTLKNSLILLAELAVIFILIMVLLEVLKHLNIISRVTSLLTPFSRFLGISSEANLPLLTGSVFGISYSGAIIIDSATSGKMSWEDIYIINLFLVVCHGLVEDTLVWAAIGAQVIPIQLARIAVAILLCYFGSRALKRISRPEGDMAQMLPNNSYKLKE
jgi:hypothetical protein